MRTASGRTMSDELVVEKYKLLLKYKALHNLSIKTILMRLGLEPSRHQSLKRRALKLMSEEDIANATSVTNK